MFPEIAIIVCKDRWVYVGRPRINPDDYMTLIVDDLAVIRVWGTTGGLAQLAREGPRKETTLDYEGDGVIVSRDDIKRMIPVLATKKWLAHFRTQKARMTDDA